MSIFQSLIMPKSSPPPCLPFCSPILLSIRRPIYTLKSFTCIAVSKTSDFNPKPDPESSSNPGAFEPKTRTRIRRKQLSNSKDEDGNGDSDSDRMFPSIIPKKPRRGRRSEAAAVEDFVRDSLERTFESIKQNSQVLENKKNVLKERVVDDVDSETSDGEEEEEEEDGDDEDVGKGRRKKKMVVEEDDPNWPLDADVGWGIRASEYFERHPIKNVVGEDGFVIDWEGEIDDNWVKEINCLEWESFAYHPSPLIVLVFERYNRATDNWKTLKELEKAIKVYWSAKDRLPPRAVKIDINIERDLAYALKVKECPQILFLMGSRIMYREKEFRTADELVQMIAHVYYKAKRPSWASSAAVSPPYSS